MTTPPYPPPPTGYREAPPVPNPEATWIAPTFAVATLGNLVQLVGFGIAIAASTRLQDLAVWLFVWAPIFWGVTGFFVWKFGRVRPQWSTPKRVLAGMFLSAGILGVIAAVAGILVVGLVAAACGACKR